MSKKHILVVVAVGVVLLIGTAGSTVLLLNSLRGTSIGNGKKTSTSEVTSVDPLKQATEYRQQALEKQSEGKHDEAIALLKKARDIYVEQKNAEQQSQTEIDIAAFEDIKEHAPPVVTGVSKASGE